MKKKPEEKIPDHMRIESMWKTFCPHCYRYTKTDKCPICGKDCIPRHKVTLWQRMLQYIV